MTRSPNTAPVNVEDFAAHAAADTLRSVRVNCEKKVDVRLRSMADGQIDFAALRQQVADARTLVLARLDHYLEEAEQSLQANGVHVHWAFDAAQACEIVVSICREAGASSVIKGKSMVSEEIELNHALQTAGFDPIETDLGEFVAQLDGDRPSHIVTPIIHKNRTDVARIFARHGVCEYTEDPAELTAAARAWLRPRLREARVGITGANFVVAESGRIVTLSNEGNVRMCANAPDVHIAITGIEKVLARDEDLAAVLKLLPRSASGLHAGVYMHFLSGPRTADDSDGPREMHLVFLDNGRSRLLGTRYHDMLRCIRCAACINVCPVFRSVSGHAYDSVYPGPMGSVLSPLLGSDAARRHYGWLARASSLCGACEEVCPAMIPIQRMLISLRVEEKGVVMRAPGTPPLLAWSLLASMPRLWQFMLAAGRRVGWGVVRWVPVPAIRRWRRGRDLPAWPRQSFRDAFRQRSRAEGDRQ